MYSIIADTINIIIEYSNIFIITFGYITPFTEIGSLSYKNLTKKLFSCTKYIPNVKLANLFINLLLKSNVSNSNRYKTLSNIMTGDI